MPNTAAQRWPGPGPSPERCDRALLRAAGGRTPIPRAKGREYTGWRLSTAFNKIIWLPYGQTSLVLSRVERRDALCWVYHQHKSGTLTPELTVAFERRFDALLDAGLQANPEAPPVPGRPGRTKQSPGRNLAMRCQQHREAVLRFLHDERVPFDNNQAERDVRPWCVKSKVSGGFCSEEGGQNFTRIRSYISTLRKQGLSV